uniref:DUF591 domain-containing protein n=1 Tax=Oryza sativa subsp. japonica TaxID=39947 RepID=Q7G1Z4_ORYSJ|nr:hypothetical protein LOC_Os10g38520 [Oryza sativa Japonica Group]
MHARRCYAAAETATRRGDKGEGRRPWGSQGEVKGIPGSVAARGIGAKGADGGGLRRRPSPAERRGNLTGATGVRFKGVGASLGLRDPVCGVGWDGEAPWRSGDERRSPRAGGMSRPEFLSKIPNAYMCVNPRPGISRGTQ